jgi:hypothetical protein
MRMNKKGKKGRQNEGENISTIGEGMERKKIDERIEGITSLLELLLILFFLQLRYINC